MERTGNKSRHDCTCIIYYLLNQVNFIFSGILSPNVENRQYRSIKAVDGRSRRVVGADHECSDSDVIKIHAKS